LVECAGKGSYPLRFGDGFGDEGLMSYIIVQLAAN
jgi:hypothetical protein